MSLISVSVSVSTSSPFPLPCLLACTLHWWCRLGVQARRRARCSTSASTWSSTRSRRPSSAPCESMRISANVGSGSRSVAFVRTGALKSARRLAFFAPAFALLRIPELDAVVTATPRCCSTEAVPCCAAPTGARARRRAPLRSRRMRSRRPSAAHHGCHPPSGGSAACSLSSWATSCRVGCSPRHRPPAGLRGQVARAFAAVTIVPPRSLVGAIAKNAAAHRAVSDGCRGRGIEKSYASSS